MALPDAIRVGVVDCGAVVCLSDEEDEECRAMMVHGTNGDQSSKILLQILLNMGE